MFTLFSWEIGLRGMLVLFAVSGAAVYMAGKLLVGAFGKHVALSDRLDAHKGYMVGADLQRLIGKKGTAYTVLRPVGKVFIDGQLYDASARNGIFIEQGTPVEVLDVESGTLKVGEIKRKMVV
jgi:membrane-bound serine protease (ClpP class)